MDDLETPVTSNGEPGGEEGSRPNETDDATTTSAPPTSQSTAGEPDAAYKGLQRVLEKSKQRERELETQLQRIQSQPADAASDQIIAGLINEINQSNPERAAQLQAGFATYRTVMENQRLRNAIDADAQDRMFRDAEERNMAELRAIVSDLGANPDDPRIDYGEADSWIAERITKVRASAKVVAAKATPVTPPQRTVDEQHNTQPGTPPPAPPKPGSKTVTEADVQAAQAEYARAYITGGNARKAAEAKLQEVNEQFAKQLFG